ncbi:hypothetical protein B0H16DRAFT_1455898 [Mycena metata]|uniref:Uncharacterized protein n=1 Tax=Mycena metata TaxID=1033252 RepID=A0AAD7JFW1_9AGAR|nr:hypothetical protein B0H16DRAFT_1455898 [Mycena metata]
MSTKEKIPQPEQHSQEQSSLEGQIKETTENTTRGVDTADQIEFGEKIYISAEGAAKIQNGKPRKAVRRAASTDVIPAELCRYREDIVKMAARLRRHRTEGPQSCVRQEIK